MPLPALPWRMALQVRDEPWNPCGVLGSSSFGTLREKRDTARTTGGTDRHPRASKCSPSSVFRAMVLGTTGCGLEPHREHLLKVCACQLHQIGMHRGGYRNVSGILPTAGPVQAKAHLAQWLEGWLSET